MKPMKPLFILALLALLLSLAFLDRAKDDFAVEKAIDRCKKSEQGQAQCFEQLLKELANKRGVGKALDTLASIHDTHEPFSGFCHDLAHTLGGEAYEQFLSGEKVIATPKSVYCNYGFFHGFMQALAGKSNDLKKAQEFCSYIDKQMAAITPDVSLQCYHGIGHGWTNAHDNPELWGDSAAIAAPALKLCEDVKDTSEQLSRCLTGVFHGIAVFSITQEYGLSVNKEDPLRFCRAQPEKYRNECYMSMYGVLRYATEDKFPAAAKFIEDISEDQYAAPAIMHLAMSRSGQNVSGADHTQGINLCRGLQERLRIPCIQGYAFGLFRHNASGQEYKEPLDFCKLPVLSEEERMACFQYIFSYLDLWYSREKAQQTCQTLEEPLRELCYSQL